MVVLGIETTCDETAAAVVERYQDGRGKILSNIVLSQVSEHAGNARRRTMQACWNVPAAALLAGSQLLRAAIEAAAGGTGCAGPAWSVPPAR